VVKRRLKEIVGVSAACLLFFLLAEVLARFAATVTSDMALSNTVPVDHSFHYSPTLGWARTPNYKGMSGLAVREFDGAGYFSVDSAQLAVPAKKVLFFGDSNTFGYGVDTPQTYPEVAERLLPGVHAINLGVMGYSSYQGLVTLEKYLPLLKPDLVVVSFNYNDRRHPFESFGIDGPEQFRKMYETYRNSPFNPGRRIFELSYFYRGVRRLLRNAGVIPESANRVRVDTLEPRVSEDSYRRNLIKMAEHARAGKIPLIFVLLKDNPLETHALNAGLQSLEQSNYALAIARLRFALRTSDHRYLARIYLAQAYRAVGQENKAEDVLYAPLRVPQLDGGEPVRLDVTYNDIMREVAKDYNGRLVDGAKVMRPEDYIDACHFNTDGHRRLGELLANPIAKLLNIPRDWATSRALRPPDLRSISGSAAGH
jgi:lysophospholipase L1-like esterase